MGVWIYVGSLGRQDITSVRSREGKGERKLRKSAAAERETNAGIRFTLRVVPGGDVRH